MARILIVDDDPEIHKLLTSMLASLGHEALCARDPQEFLRLARDQRPGLVFMDMQMPGGGAPMIKAMVEGNEELGRLPMVFLSGMRVEQMKLWFPEKPGRLYLTKPARLKAIQAAIEELLVL